ncbi:MAG: biotin/lipoate A/B protein ligase family protein [Candidatus Micrarchaeia archaeon]
MRIRLLETGSHDAFWNMALDEAMMEQAGDVPSLRLYAWNPPAVSIGYFQRLSEEVDVAKCEELGVDVVRRITGGGAVFHDAELTYSFITRSYPADIRASYRLVCDAILKGLAGIGVQGQFVPLNDLVCNGRKFSGNAQTRRKGVLLQHGTILLKVDVEKMFSLLKVPDEKMRGKLIQNVKERVTGLDREFGEVAEALKRGFSSHFGAQLEPSKPTKEELERAAELAETKYATEEWLNRV